MNSLEMSELKSRILNNRSVLYGRDGSFEDFEELLALLRELAKVWRNYSRIDDGVVSVLMLVASWLWGWTLDPANPKTSYDYDEAIWEKSHRFSLAFLESVSDHSQSFNRQSQEVNEVQNLVIDSNRERAVREAESRLKSELLKRYAHDVTGMTIEQVEELLPLFKNLSRFCSKEIDKALVRVLYQMAFELQLQAISPEAFKKGFSLDKWRRAALFFHFCQMVA